MRTIELNNGKIGYVKDNVMSLIEFVKENFSEELGRILHNECMDITEKKDFAVNEFKRIDRDTKETIGNLEDEVHRLENENRMLENKVRINAKTKTI